MDCTSVLAAVAFLSLTDESMIDRSNGTITTVDANMRLAHKAPQEGNFTVESDREIMKLLEVMAWGLTYRLDRGASLMLFHGLGRAQNSQASALL